VKNVGHKTAASLTATIVSLNPLVTVNDNSASFGSVTEGSTANCSSNPFNLTASANAPRGQMASLAVTYSANGATQTDTLAIQLGQKLTSDPQGPDAYGYYCYDNTDSAYTPHPTYNWVEIDPAFGGSGTQLAISDTTEELDMSVIVNLPFSFRYYGQNTTQITVCSNGWLSIVPNVSFSDFRNYRIPAPMGPYGQICPFWDDLTTSITGHVFAWNDAVNHRYIIEWSRLNILYSQTLETFEVFLYDPAYTSTPTGDGEIVFQYQTVTDEYGYNPNDNPYSTVGIESPDQQTGLQIVYWNTYEESAAAHLQNGRAYKFTTVAPGVQPPSPVNVTMTPLNPPIMIPANGGSFQFNATVQRTVGPAAPFYAWARDRNPDGTYTGNLLGPVNVNPPVGVTVTRMRTQVVSNTWPAGVHYYVGYANTAVGYPAMDADSFSWTKSTSGNGGPTVTTCENFGESFAPYEVVPTAGDGGPTAFGLDQNRPNPFNPVTAISFKLQASSHVSLKVFDVTGRMVAALVDGWNEAGSHQVTFDGSKLSSGLYFVKMQAGDYGAVKKMMLIK
jgi:hypothetical protein